MLYQIQIQIKKINSKIEFIVDDEDDVDDKQSRLSRKNSKSNIDGSERRSRKNSLSDYSVSNYSVLLNEFCSTSTDQINQDIDDEKIIKKKSGFANTVATFFSSKKKEDEQQQSCITPTKKLHRSRSASEASTERTNTLTQDPLEIIRTLSIEPSEDQTHNESKSNQLPTTTYTIPSKTKKISTQSLLTPSANNNNHHQHSFRWLHRLSNRFNSSTSTTSTTTETSSTGLIFENRPINLPPKSNEENT